jgi:hypothetical protein
MLCFCCPGGKFSRPLKSRLRAQLQFLDAHIGNWFGQAFHSMFIKIAFAKPQLAKTARNSHQLFMQQHHLPFVYAETAGRLHCLRWSIFLAGHPQSHVGRAGFA